MPLTIRFRICLLLGLILSGPPACGAEPPAPKDKFLLFILAGQSNMAGRGEVGDEDRIPHPRVFCFNKSREWVPAVDPLHFDKPAVTGTGLGRSFAIRIAEAYPEMTIGLIPCAVGGSPITTWEPLGFHEQTQSFPWDDCADRVRAALPDGVLSGVLWHQGESDANPTWSKKYEGRLLALVARFREEFHTPDLPILIGQLGKFEGIEWSADQCLIDAVHRKVAREDPRCAFISSEGLRHKGDQVHFDSPSLRTFGQRYAEELLRLHRP